MTHDQEIEKAQKLWLRRLAAFERINVKHTEALNLVNQAVMELEKLRRAQKEKS